VKQSKFFHLGVRDLVQGAIVAGIAPILFVLENFSFEHASSINWKAAGITGAVTGLAYLLKNLFTPPDKDQKPTE